MTGIKAAMTLYPGVALGVAAIIVAFFYGLSDTQYEKIAEDLSNGVWKKARLNSGLDQYNIQEARL